jgi:uncharacterized protein
VLDEIAAPTLIVHGTQDTFISIESSRAAVHQFTAEHKLVEIEGAQHGFAVHNDPTYANPQSQQWQAFVIRAAAKWVMANTCGVSGLRPPHAGRAAPADCATA